MTDREERARGPYRCSFVCRFSLVPMKNPFGSAHLIEKTSLQGGTARDPHGGEVDGTDGTGTDRLDEPIPESARPWGGGARSAPPRAGGASDCPAPPGWADPLAGREWKD